MKKKIKNILDATALIAWIVAASAIDSDSLIPFAVCSFAAIWFICSLDIEEDSKGGECNAVDR